jgi:membrane carboxypeptidase/penicillin-binding protein
VQVKAITEDGAFQRWSYRQVPAIQGGFMAMDTQNGRVLAMQGGFSYQSSVFNRATQALRQPGSSFKPFVYAAALDNGYSPATIVHDVEVRVDGPLATVWTYYDFFAGGEFSHCGYDAMQLLKVRGDWKIVALADTRRTEGCRPR